MSDAVSPSASMSRDEIAALLRFYAEAGVDVALDGAPHDRFAESARPPSPTAQTPLPERTPPRALAAPPPPQEATISAQAAAAAARDLDGLRAALVAFDGCALKATAMQLVFGDGDPQSKIMLLGDVPGADDDRAGKPFAGKAGALLDRMLAAIGLRRNQAYIANLVPWRPPGNRAPFPHEIAACLPFAARQVELVNPDILVCLGSPPTQALLGVREGITQTRGRWRDYQCGARSIRALPMFHPDYLLSQPKQKRLAWRDLQELRRAIDAAG